MKLYSLNAIVERRERKRYKKYGTMMPAYNKRSLRDLSLHPQDSVVGLVSLPQSLFDGVLVRHVRIRRLGGDLVPEAGLAVPTIGLKRRAQF